MKFITHVMDPPWNERGGGKVKRGADRHYPLLKNNQAIVDVVGPEMPVLEKGDGATLWMFATSNFLDDAIRLMGMLGFQYVTNAVWVKGQMMEVSSGLDMFKPQAPGLGQRMRLCHEHLLFGRSGKVPVPTPGHRLPSVIYAPRGRHSEKPEEAFDLLQTHDEGCALRLTANGPVEHEKYEFFARKPRPGWHVWGNEV